mmetsp:Transcript_22381/g.19881  ORF Transcript_22381/g.19881 Transcript_22381/m.19881 type:complete len:105 (+) Transcript_22381:568-882(+)
MTTTTGLFFYTVMSKTMRTSIQTKLFSLSILGVLGGMGYMARVNGRFYHFLVHVDDKYFYGTTLQQLQDGTIIKTNKPKSFNFETPSWSFKKKLMSLKALGKFD